MKKLLLLVLVAAIGVAGWRVWHHQAKVPAALSPAVITKAKSIAAAAPTHCVDNSLTKLILVSVSAQHMWACAGPSQVYDAAVITGMELYPADLTPTGTYQVEGRQTSQTLAGHDATGSWNDFVHYWMPFLTNQYGTYGFHDATWRGPADFGNVNINAPYTAAAHGSHGCVEMPLAAMKWLYGWAGVGTHISIVS